MTITILAGVFALSAAIGLLIVLTGPLHHRWTGDKAGSGVQKHHEGNPPRVGAVPILAGCALGYGLMAAQLPAEETRLFGYLLLCSVPAALIGLLEDVTKAVRARWRLLAPAVGAAAGIASIGTLVPPIGVPGLDALLAWTPFAVALTLLMVVGFTQAMNIVDGLNGLSSGLALLMLGATSWVAFAAGDTLVGQITLVLAAAIGGFFVLNFPRGALFLGDGGAYFIGFICAQVWLLLLVRNAGEVSVWFVMAIAAHATTETIFSIIRRKFLRNRVRPATAPDRLHLHTLVLRRRVGRVSVAASRGKAAWAINSTASAAVLLRAAPFIGIALIAPHSIFWSFCAFLLAVAGYLGQFWYIARFRNLGRWASALRADRTDDCSPAPTSRIGELHSSVSGKAGR